MVGRKDFDKRARELARTFRTYPALLADELGQALYDSGADWFVRMGKRFTAGQAGRGNKSTTLHNRSGNLYGSLNWKAKRGKRLRDVSLILRSSGVPYALMQEFGGTVRPKKAKYLTIPLEGAVTPTGVLRRSMRKWIERTKGAKAPNERLRTTRDKSGQRLVFLVKGGRGKGKSGRGSKLKMIPLFLLTKGPVKIPGPKTGKPSRLAFFKTWEGGAGKRTERFQKAQLGALRRAIAGERG